MEKSLYYTSVTCEASIDDAVHDHSVHCTQHLAPDPISANRLLIHRFNHLLVQGFIWWMCVTLRDSRCGRCVLKTAEVKFSGVRPDMLALGNVGEKRSIELFRVWRASLLPPLSLVVSIQSLDFFCCCLCTHAELAYLSAGCASEPRCTSSNPFPEAKHKGRCPYVMTTNLLSFSDPNAMQENGPSAPAGVYGALMNGLLAARSSHCTFFIIMIITIECKLHFSLLPLNPRCSVNMTHTLGSCKREMTSLTNVYIWRTTFARVKKHVFWPLILTRGASQKY